MWMLTRILVITAGLAAAGFVAGGLVGVVMMAGWLMMIGAFSPEMLLLGGVFGAVVGAVFGPVAAWLLMRRVPLWLALAGTAGGTLAGAAFGALTGGVGASFVCAWMGFGTAVVFLRRQELERARALPAADAAPSIARARHSV
jgi:hypothetical protein